MTTYNVGFWGLAGDDWEGDMDVEFSDQEIETIKEVIREDYCESFDYAGLEEIQDRLIPLIAEWMMNKWDGEFLCEIYDLYGEKGKTDKDAVIKYLRRGVNICIPEEIIEEAQSEDEEDEEE